MPQSPIDIVFVHGWSVTNTRTYGGLPERLVSEGSRHGLKLQKRHIYLGRYVSFHDEVRVEDIAAAMEAAVTDQKLGSANRFFCVTHSTGGPVVREWFDRFYARKRKTCPMSHLVMLAPANFGSALAQLGKGRLGRMKSWFGGIEPGQGVLDWLELGSAHAFELNKRWIHEGDKTIGGNGYFPFVIAGQTIDRKAYDHLNSYTGELGSDGVVRVAAANLSSSYICLKQFGNPDEKGYSRLRKSAAATSASSALRVVSGKSHSGTKSGIMSSVKRARNLRGAAIDGDTVESIMRCFQVGTRRDYDSLVAQFAAETAVVQKNDQVEIEKRTLAADRTFIHDRYSQIVFRIKDTEGYCVEDFDLLLTAGANSDPNHLPAGFFRDRQANKIDPSTITYFVNYDVMAGSPEIPGVRAKLEGTRSLGFILHPRPASGFVHYQKCRIRASENLFKAVIRPNQTTLIDIVLTRIVHKETFRIERTSKQRSFKNARPGKETTQ